MQQIQVKRSNIHMNHNRKTATSPMSPHFLQKPHGPSYPTRWPSFSISMICGESVPNMSGSTITRSNRRHCHQRCRTDRTRCCLVSPDLCDVLNLFQQSGRRIFGVFSSCSQSCNRRPPYVLGTSHQVCCKFLQQCSLFSASSSPLLVDVLCQKLQNIVVVLRLHIAILAMPVIGFSLLFSARDLPASVVTPDSCK